MDNCNEISRGEAHRNHDVLSLGTCAGGSQTTAWGWHNPEVWTHCRFARRDPKSLKKMLNHRKIVFVGDSGLRNIYHATGRQLGDMEAGNVDTKLEKWSDQTNTVGKTDLKFKWAPYAPDQVTNLKALIADTSTTIDVIVMGGGAWDRLHKYSNNEDKKIFESAVDELAKQIKFAQAAGIPVVWQIPTTINTAALQTDEKKANIREQQMEEVRCLYEAKHVLESASFVLDGPAFSAGRVLESYDGVHYPFVVYEAGAQILLNAMDWLLPERDTSDPFTPNQPGKMADPMLGGMILCFAVMGLFFFDGFMGVSYLASLFVPSVTPFMLYDEAFSTLHRKAGLPELHPGGTPHVVKTKQSDIHGGGEIELDSGKSSEREEDDDHEIESLLSKSEGSGSSS